ncbi:MAG: hypothetical protein L0219_04260 [Phycisphaerales bacterium]|nr:hypothetical protein [Phycisphaerales bacterium]
MREQAAHKIGTFADAIRQSANELGRDQQLASVAGYFEQAADRIEPLSDYLREHDVRDVLDDVEHWARRNPAIFLGGAFVAGLLIARFFKSSREGRLHGHFDALVESEFGRRRKRPRRKTRFGRQDNNSRASVYGGGFTAGSTTPGMTEPGFTPSGSGQTGSSTE